jgi:hypothetical protein
MLIGFHARAVPELAPSSDLDTAEDNIDSEANEMRKTVKMTQTALQILIRSKVRRSRMSRRSLQ